MFKIESESAVKDFSVIVYIPPQSFLILVVCLSPAHF